MKCEKCGCERINFQVINEIKLKRKKKGFIYWLLIGWWLELLLWIFLTIPRLFIALLPKQQKTVNRTKTLAVCQNCGHTWNV